MVKILTASLVRLAPVLALGACAVPKAIVVELPKSSTTDPAPPPAELAQTKLPSQPDDGIRLPDMLGMPGDGEFRATAPNAPKGGPDASAVISRPPTDPPSRPKPKDKKSEP